MASSFLNEKYKGWNIQDTRFVIHVQTAECQHLPWSNAELWNGLCEVWMGDWQAPKEEEKDQSFS